jgi:hypothetical protein
MRSYLSILKFLIYFTKLSQADKLAFNSWWRRGFSSPAPHFIKTRILGSITAPDVWIETGTLNGDTAKFLSEKFITSKVITIEPSVGIFAKAKSRLAGFENIEVICGTSESEFKKVLDRLVEQRTESVAFWLDGHYSGGATYLGDIETPIRFELGLIAGFLTRFKRVTIFIDDFRLFVQQVESYPATSFLSNWAEMHGLSWNVEHDIFIITKSEKNNNILYSLEN